MIYIYIHIIIMIIIFINTIISFKQVSLMIFQYPPALGRNIEYTNPAYLFEGFLGILAHLLRMVLVMEPKYLAFRRRLYTPIILWRSVIGSLGHETWSNNMHVGTTPKMPRNCAIVPGEVTAMMFDGSELHLPIRNHKTTINQDDPTFCFTPF